eukprot:TRINITY_DN15403_c0_g1_i1.p1 TRINITY_DN15403_c0_g1~~TRINITY_DN15403_c0_g1_i1.p1  ORF type:complete len:138 (-),score=29.52 TRINITY_DN15403_c0_g1_i1:133-516(-)
MSARLLFAMFLCLTVALVQGRFSNTTYISVSRDGIPAYPVQVMIFNKYVLSVVYRGNDTTPAPFWVDLYNIAEGSLAQSDHIKDVKCPAYDCFWDTPSMIYSPDEGYVTLTFGGSVSSSLSIPTMVE